MCMERIYGTYMETPNGTYMARLGKYMERIWNGDVDEEKAFLMGRHNGDDAPPKCWREVEIYGTCVESVEKRIWVLGS